MSSSTSNKEREPCTICKKDTSIKCSTCKSAYYCSTECQSLDRPLHKLLCSKYVEFLATRPAPRSVKDQGSSDPLGFPCILSFYKLALLLPVGAAEPCLIWLEIKTYLEEQDKKDGPQFESQWDDVKKHTKEPEDLYFKENGHTYVAWMEEARFGGGEENVCLATLNRGYEAYKPKADAKSSCASPVIICRITEFELENGKGGKQIYTKYEDTTLAELRYAYNYYAQFNHTFEGGEQNEFYIRQPGEWVKGVRVYNNGAVENSGKRKYQQVELKRTGDVFNKENPKVDKSSIAELLGFPLLACPIILDPSVKLESKDIGLNEEIQLLLMSTDVDSPIFRNFGHCINPMRWEVDDENSALVVREDSEDLDVKQVEVLVAYCEEVVRTAIDRADLTVHDNLAQAKVTKQALLDDNVTRAKFEEYFAGYRERKIAKGDFSWSDAKLPYLKTRALLGGESA